MGEREREREREREKSVMEMGAAACGVGTKSKALRSRKEPGAPPARPPARSGEGDRGVGWEVREGRGTAVGGGAGQAAPTSTTPPNPNIPVIGGDQHDQHHCKPRTGADNDGVAEPSDRCCSAGAMRIARPDRRSDDQIDIG